MCRQPKRVALCVPPEAWTPFFIAIPSFHSLFASGRSEDAVKVLPSAMRQEVFSKGVGVRTQ